MLHISLKNLEIHCVKSVQIRSFFWSVFSRIWTTVDRKLSKTAILSSLPIVISQITFICSKSTIETLEKDVNYLRS